MRHPLPTFAAGALTGALACAQRWTGPLSPLTLSALLGAGALAGGAALWGLRARAPRGIAGALFGLGLVTGGLLVTPPAPAPRPPQAHSRHIKAELLDLRPAARGARALARAEGGATLHLYLPDAPGELLPGDQIWSPAQVTAPAPARNPGGPSPWALAHRHPRLQASADAPLRIRAGAPTFPRALSRARFKTAGAIDAAAPPQTRGLLRALTLGDKSALRPAQLRTFARAGLSHLLAVSGLHLGLVAGLLLFALRWLLTRAPRPPLYPLQVAAVAVAPWVGAAVYWVGHPSSAVRAGVMTLGLLLPLALGRRPTPWGAWGLAALLTLAVAPERAASPGLTLSLAAVAGLLSAGWLIAPPTLPPPWGARPLRATWSLLGASLATSVTTAPLLVAYFGQVPLAGLVANLVAIPLTTALVPLCALAAGASALGAGTWAWTLPSLLAAGLMKLASLSAGLPLASLVLAPISLPAAALGSLAGALALGPMGRPARARGWRRGLLAGLWLLSLSGGLGRPGEPPPGPLCVTFFDVGHGDAILIQTEGAAVLVDAGGDPTGQRDPGHQLVVPALRALGVRRLDALVLTHPHPDHFGGAAAVLSALPVDALYHGGAPGDGPYGELLTLAQALGIPAHTLCGAALPSLAPATLDCLWPLPDPAGETYDLLRLANDNSVTLRLQLGEIAVLLTGDVEEEAEAALIEAARRPGAPPLWAQVVKAPHHGSATSSTPAFIAQTEAQHVIYTAAVGGIFNFPRPAVRQRWEAAGARGWQTGALGAIQVWTDGRALEIRAFDPRTRGWRSVAGDGSRAPAALRPRSPPPAAGHDVRGDRG